jgi:hypothetical protein
MSVQNEQVDALLEKMEDADDVIKVLGQVASELARRQANLTTEQSIRTKKIIALADEFDGEDFAEDEGDT